MDMSHYISYYVCPLPFVGTTLYYIMLQGLKTNIRIVIAINVSFGDNISCRMWKSVSIYIAEYVSSHIILYYIISLLIATRWHYIIIALKKKEKRKKEIIFSSLL